MPSPEFENVERRVKVSDAERAAYSLTAGEVVVDDWWVEQPIDAQWLAAARLVFDDRGEPVIAELRVFPKERQRPPSYSGHWNAQVRGVRAKGVPRGGLPATLLRRRLQLAPLEREAREALNAFSRAAKTMPAGHIAQAYAGLTEAGYVRKSAKKRPPRSGRGRPPLLDKLLAETARDYVRFLDAGKQPNVELVKAHGITLNTAKGRVKKARAEGFLTPANGHGKAGGSVTTKTKDVLAKAGRR